MRLTRYFTNAQGNTHYCTTEGTMNLTERARIRTAIATHWCRGKW